MPSTRATESTGYFATGQRPPTPRSVTGFTRTGLIDDHQRRRPRTLAHRSARPRSMEVYIYSRPRPPHIRMNVEVK